MNALRRTLCICWFSLEDRNGDEIDARLERAA